MTGGKSVNKSQPEKCVDPNQIVGRGACLFLGRPQTDFWVRHTRKGGGVRRGGEILCRSDGSGRPFPPSSPNQNTSGVDWISGLPDDILVGILSTLPLKEAARTSILSPRWENLWKHTLRLDFDADAALHRIIKHGDNPKVRTLERRKYINWVNKVLLRSYKGFALKELRICFDLDKPTAQKAINHWLQFAFERRVERLELDLSKDGDFPRYSDICTLPRKKFKPHQPRSLFDSLKYLKALTLKSVDLTHRDVDVILRSCTFLEHLVIQHTTKISNLNICGAAAALKHLEILFCVRIKSQKVSAPNLVSLKVTDAKTLLLENVPKLVDFDVCSRVEKVHSVLALFGCPSQLEILTLELDFKKETMENFNKCELPQLPKLKKLEIVFCGRGDESMFGLTTPLIRAAPFLQQLVIKMRWFELLRKNRNFKTVLNSPHQHLKVVNFLGYYGRSSDEELVRYLVDNCVVLETLIIDPRIQPDFPHFPLELGEIDGELTREKRSTRVYPEEFDGLVAVKTSRKYAMKQLQGQIPQHVQLVIL